jgi:phosphohistidine phosphatase
MRQAHGPFTTMRRLILFRHAKAERSQPGERDIARPLVEQGRKDVARIGAYMATHGLIPDRVLVSPAVRSVETWKSASVPFRPAPATATIERLYDANAHTLLAIVRDVPASVHTLLIVGHNPGLHELALMLIASGDIEAREQLSEKLPTSGLVVLDFALDAWSELHPHSGRLDRFVTPKSLESGGW